MMKDVKFFERMTKTGKTIFAKSRNITCSVMSSDSTCFDDMTRTEGQGIVFNAHSTVGERFVFAEKYCCVYLDYKSNDIDGIEAKYKELKSKLPHYNLSNSKILDVPPLNGKSGLYYMKINFEKLTPPT